MSKQEYRFIFYLDAMHSIITNGVRGSEHQHTWKIGLTVFKLNDNFIEFHEFEQVIKEFLSIYQNKNFDRLPYFEDCVPTIENITEYFKVQLESLLFLRGWQLLRIEISDSPNRTYIYKTDHEAPEKHRNLSTDPVGKFFAPKPLIDKTEAPASPAGPTAVQPPVSEPPYTKPSEYTEHFAAEIPEPQANVSTSLNVIPDAPLIPETLLRDEEAVLNNNLEQYVDDRFNQFFEKISKRHDFTTPIPEPLPTTASPKVPPLQAEPKPLEQPKPAAERISIPKPSYSYTIPNIDAKPIDGFASTNLTLQEPADPPSTFEEIPLSVSKDETQKLFKNIEHAFSDFHTSLQPEPTPSDNRIFDSQKIRIETNNYKKKREIEYEQPVLYRELETLIQNERSRIKKRKRLLLLLISLLALSVSAVVILKILHII